MCSLRVKPTKVVILHSMRNLRTYAVHQNTRSRLTHQSIIHLLNRHKNCGGSTEDTFQVYSPGGDLPYNKAKIYALISGITKDDV